MLRTRWKNWELRRDRRKLEKESKRVQAEAWEKKSDEIYEEWYSIHSWEFYAIDASVRENDSRDLLDEAEKLYLPTPGRNDDYRDKWMSDADLNLPGGGSPYSVLTPEAMMELNALIRNERRARREVWESWAKIAGTIVASLTGIIGTIIGLVAISKK
jgi:hypothetical protein